MTNRPAAKTYADAGVDLAAAAAVKFSQDMNAGMANVDSLIPGST